MAKTQPSPKQALITQLMIFAMIFLGFQLWTNHMQQTDVRSSVDILKEMQGLSQKAQDADIAKDDQTLTQRLGQEVGSKTLTQDEADRSELEGAIITIDSLLNAGEQHKDNGRMQNAWQLADKLFSKFHDSPMWNSMQVQVYDPAAVWTGSALYAHVVERLSDWNRHDLIFGFIPGFQVVDYLVRVTGAKPDFSYWFACFLLALCVRALIFPLSQKQMMWGRQMAQLTPLLKEIKDRYKDNPTEQQTQTMNLYKEYGLNPLAGCLPVVVQMPLFITVLQFMQRYRFEFQKGTFLWMNPSTPASAFLAQNLGQQDKALIILYGVTMTISTLLTPVNDPTQVRQQRLMGVGIALVFTVSMLMGAFPVPAAFVLYWTFTNLLATAQSLRAYRMPLPALQKIVAPTGGVLPTRKPSFMDRMNAMMQEQMEKEEQRKAAEAGGTTPALGNGSTNGASVPERNGQAKPRSGNPNIRRPKRRK